MAEESKRGELIDKVVKIRRCAAVVKGGRRFSFTALVVVGDGQGKVGWGYGKANEVPPSVEKAVKDELSFLSAQKREALEDLIETTYSGAKVSIKAR